MSERERPRVVTCPVCEREAPEASHPCRFGASRLCVCWDNGSASTRRLLRDCKPPAAIAASALEA